MRILGKKLDDFEAACRDGTRVAWFGSYVIGEEKVTIHPGGRWWSGDELQQAADAPATMGAHELDRKLAGY